MTKRFSFTVNGETASTIDLTEFTTLDDEGVLTLSEPETTPKAQNSNVFSIGESKSNLSHLGVRVNANKIPEYWDSLNSDRNFHLDRTVQNLRLWEAERQAINNLLPARPQWTSLAEIIGDLCELERIHGREEINLEQQEIEVRRKIKGHIKSSNIDLGSKERYSTGMPELMKEIEGIRSEIRLATEISRLKYGFEFEKTPGDILVDTTPELHIDVTRVSNIPIQLDKKKNGDVLPKMEIDEKTASVDAAVASLRKNTWNRIQSKIGDEVNIVAIDISNTMEAFQLFSLQEFGRADIYHLDKQLDYLSEAIKNNKQGVLFFATVATASSPQMITISSTAS